MAEKKPDVQIFEATVRSIMHTKVNRIVAHDVEEAALLAASTALDVEPSHDVTLATPPEGFDPYVSYVEYPGECHSVLVDTEGDILHEKTVDFDYRGSYLIPHKPPFHDAEGPVPEGKTRVRVKWARVVICEAVRDVDSKYISDGVYEAPEAPLDLPTLYDEGRDGHTTPSFLVDVQDYEPIFEVEVMDKDGNYHLPPV